MMRRRIEKERKRSVVYVYLVRTIDRADRWTDELYDTYLPTYLPTYSFFILSGMSGLQATYGYGIGDSTRQSYIDRSHCYFSL